MSEDKSIDTLVADIQKLLDPTVNHIPDKENLVELCRSIVETMNKFLKEDKRGNETFRLRASNIGKPQRQLWFESRAKGGMQSKFSADKLMSFLYGSVIEHLLVFLAKEAGHKVTNIHEKVEVDGIQGELDFIIDGHVVDAKSSSFRGFEKFRDGTLLKGEDPFGYRNQISFYSQAKGINKAAFLAFEKSQGQMALLKLNDLDIVPVSPIIKELKEMLVSDTMPKRCYEDTAVGTSGNRGLCKNCTFCPFKMECWKDTNKGRGLQVYKYSNGPVYLTHIEREPNVENITHEFKSNNV